MQTHQRIGGKKHERPLSDEDDLNPGGEIVLDDNVRSTKRRATKRIQKHIEMGFERDVKKEDLAEERRQIKLKKDRDERSPMLQKHLTDEEYGIFKGYLRVTCIAASMSQEEFEEKHMDDRDVSTTVANFNMMRGTTLKNIKKKCAKIAESETMVKKFPAAKIILAMQPQGPSSPEDPPYTAIFGEPHILGPEPIADSLSKCIVSGATLSENDVVCEIRITYPKAVPVVFLAKKQFVKPLRLYHRYNTFFDWIFSKAKQRTGKQVVNELLDDHKWENQIATAFVNARIQAIKIERDMTTVCSIRGQS